MVWQIEGQTKNYKNLSHSTESNNIVFLGLMFNFPDIWLLICGISLDIKMIGHLNDCWKHFWHVDHISSNYLSDFIFIASVILQCVIVKIFFFSSQISSSRSFNNVVHDLTFLVIIYWIDSFRNVSSCAIVDKIRN